MSELTVDEFADMFVRRAEREPLPLDPANTVLLLIDMQKCILPDHFWEFARSRGIPEADCAEAIGRIEQDCQATVAAGTRVLQAARAAGIRPIHVRIQELLEDGADVGLSHRRKNFKVLPGSEAAQFLPGVEPIAGEIVLDKSCSGAVLGTNLDRILRNLGIENVVTIGFYTDQCVSSRVRDLSDSGYSVGIVADACGAITPKHHETALWHLRNVYAAIESSEEFLARLG